MKTQLRRAPRLAAALAAAAVVLVPVHARAGLVGHWTFDDDTGDALRDASGLGNHGVLVNAVAATRTTGRGGAGGALYFDGTTGAGTTYASIPDAPSLHLSTAASFAAWVRCDDVGRDAPILAKEGYGHLCYWFGAFGTGSEGSSRGSFGVLFDTDGNQPWTFLDRNQGHLPEGLWAHVASTWDGTTVRHYLNGVALPQTAAFAGPVNVSDNPLVIGANVPYRNTAFRGAVDDVRVYDHALSPDDVRALAGEVPRLVGHWSFDEASGDVAVDSSGLGNHGALVNASAGTRVPGLRGGALRFDGTTGPNAAYVRIEDSESLHLASGMTASAWVWSEDVTRDAPVLAKEGDGKLSFWFGAFGVELDGSGPGNFGVLLSEDGQQPWTLKDRDQGALPAGRWVHIAATWDGATVRHYMDGTALPQTSSFAGPIRPSDAFLAIGVNSLYTFAARQTAFRGAIDEVSLYNHALAPDAIRALYLAAAFRITSVRVAGDDVRVAFEAIPGRSYQLEAGTIGAGGAGVFAPVGAVLALPAGSAGTSLEAVDAGALARGASRLYRVALLP